MKFSKVLVAGLVMVGVVSQALAIQVTGVNGIASRDGTNFYLPSTTAGLQFSGVYSAGEDPSVYALIQTSDQKPTSKIGVGSWGANNTFLYYPGQAWNVLTPWDGVKDKAVTLIGNNAGLAYPSITGVGINPPALAFTSPSTVTIKKYVPETITITPIKAAASQTVSVNMTVANEDAGKMNDFYIVVNVPGVGIFSCTAATTTACTSWTPGILPLFSNTTPTENQTVVTQIDLTGLKGATVYAGYAWGGKGVDQIGVGRAWKYTSQFIQ